MLDIFEIVVFSRGGSSRLLILDNLDNGGISFFFPAPDTASGTKNGAAFAESRGEDPPSKGLIVWSFEDGRRYSMGQGWSSGVVDKESKLVLESISLLLRGIACSVVVILACSLKVFRG